VPNIVFVPRCAIFPTPASEIARADVGTSDVVHLRHTACARRAAVPGKRILRGCFGLTPPEQKKNMPCRQPKRELPMSAPSSLSDNSRYEQACDQAIAMCDGNLRSTIKALIMANEYLETELEELQAAIAAGCVPARAYSSEVATGSRDESAKQKTGSSRASSSAA
jgi:hypothetical protein